jgi:hypothetical protein
LSDDKGLETDDLDFDFYEPKYGKGLEFEKPELWVQQREADEPEVLDVLGNIHIHEVTPSGRYVVVVSYLGDIADERFLVDKARITQASLEAWWDSGDKFMVLVSGPDFEILVTRVDDDGVEIAVGLEDMADDGNGN